LFPKRRRASENGLLLPAFARSFRGAIHSSDHFLKELASVRNFVTTMPALDRVRQSCNHRRAVSFGVFTLKMKYQSPLGLLKPFRGRRQESLTIWLVHGYSLHLESSWLTSVDLILMERTNVLTLVSVQPLNSAVEEKA
jgi:hypothetical protein